MSSVKRLNQLLLHPIVRAARSLAPAGAGMLIAATPWAQAAPQGGQVVAGQAAITQGGTATTVLQGSARAVIDWRSFSIGAGESVRFVQPNASAWVLNRVLGNDPSAILGSLSANGQVLLINPNGILFGKGSRVDVGGLVASTANVANDDFMAGRLRFSQPGRAGARVENQGSITVADGGLVALVGREVANSGVITARLGKVALAAGDAFVLDLYGDRLVNIIVDPQALAEMRDASGVPLAARVDHTGRIVADGGTVQLTVGTVQALVDNVINVSGTIRASSFESAPGRISLRGDDRTRLNLAGTLDTSGLRGGQIEVSAGRVALAAGARADASGELGGGRIDIGGKPDGGSLAAASEVSVAASALIDASATRSGDGGKVTLWSAGDMGFAGRVNARGGARGGDGGNVEVSGQTRLGFDGDVDASAQAGRAGRLLLDPTNLIVSGSGGSETLPGASSTGDFTVKAVAVNRQLVNGTSVTLQASNDITVNADAVIDGRVAGGGPAGGGLTLQADRDIAINGLIILNNGAFTATAGRAFSQASAAAVATGTGAIGITSAAALTATNLLSSGAVGLESTGAGVNVTQALGGAGGARASLVTVKGRGDVVLAGGALASGAVTLTSSAGKVDASGATLDAGGAVTLAGATGVSTAAVVTPAAVSINGGTGAVSLGAVAGAAGTVDANTAKATGLTVRTSGNVTLGGAGLGTGGLLVEGASSGLRAAAVDFGAASVFSTGDVKTNAAGITLGNAGIKSGGALTLDASGALASGAGKLESAGAASLVAGTTATIGQGGLEVTGAQKASLTAAGVLTVGGALKSAGAVELSSTGASIALNSNVNAASFTANANGNLTQATTSAVATGAGAITMASTSGNVAASNLLSTGAVGLSATQGTVTVGASMSGASGQRLASLQATARGDVRISGALVSGAVTLTSSAGKVDASGATLDAGGAVTLAGATGVSTAAVVTPAAVSINGGTGAVSLGAVAGAAGTVDANTAKATGLTVRTSGNVTLGGAALGTGGLLVEGASSGLRAAAVDFGAASVFSTGDVKTNAAGITMGTAGIASTAGAVQLNASGAFASGSKQISAFTTASVVAGTTLGLGTGGLSAGGNLSLQSVGDLTATGPIKTLGGVATIGSSAGSVKLDEIFTWDTGIASSGSLIVSALRDVTLGKPLGGPNTGYLLLADRYQPNLRPQVGAVTITAGRDVELNGLNLDGSTTSPGLSVTAGRNLVSNELIAVNKGDILLRSTSLAANEGIYLGSAVYSRGLDLATGKTGYNVTIGGTGAEGTRGNIFLFDNTSEVAFVPNVLGFNTYGLRELAKIILANNVANFKRQGTNGLESDPTLVDATNLSSVAVTVGADGLYGVAFSPTSSVGAIRIATLQSDLAASRLFNGSLDSATIRTSSNTLSSGISLKVQSFLRAGDSATNPQAVTGTDLQNQSVCSFGSTYAQCGFASVDGVGYEIDNNGNTRFFRYGQDDGFPEVGGSGTAGYKLVVGSSDFSGAANGFVNKLPAAYRTSSLTTQIQNDEPILVDSNTNTYRVSNTGTVGYVLGARLVQVDATAGSRVTRVLIGNAVMRTASEDASFNATGGLNGGLGSNTSDAPASMASGGNSNQGFTAVGAFGGQATGSASTGVSNGSSTSTGFSPLATGAAGASAANVATTSTSFGSQAAGAAATGGANASGAAASFGAQPVGAAGALAGNGFTLPAASPAPPPAPDGQGLVLRPAEIALPDIVVLIDDSVQLGGRPAAQADFGRSGAGSGFVASPFGKRFPLVRVIDGSVCGDNQNVQPAAAAGASARTCSPGRR